MATDLQCCLSIIMLLLYLCHVTLAIASNAHGLLIVTYSESESDLTSPESPFGHHLPLPDQSPTNPISCISQFNFSRCRSQGYYYREFGYKYNC